VGEREFEFPGTQRFEVLSRLGAGGMGVVYEVFDRDTHQRAALKTLSAKNAEMLLRFKEEFRTLQNIEHPNLVTLGELFEERGQWFFTMELVDGVNYVRYVRRQPVDVGAAIFDDARLRGTLPQLAQALQILHTAHKVHRDIKPSNILVTAEGRVVLLDFGFIIDTVSRGHTTAGIVVGTADYMAPEQAAGKPVQSSADWYALGVVLYRALTGKLPYSGSRMEVLMRKQQVPPKQPSLMASGVPADLDDLCMRLLSIAPKHRADGDDIYGTLGIDPERTYKPTALEPTEDQPFVGRQKEIWALHDALVQARRGRSVTVYLTGESGVGKTALLQRFATSAVAGDSRTVVLFGRCHERESVPYKAVDGIVDSLSRTLRRDSRDDVAALLPMNISQLAQIFPVLRRVEVIAEAPPALKVVQDPLELRHRMFGAMRELLARAAERRPFVVIVEDLQWVDGDSLALLRDVMNPPDEPPMLLIASTRTDASASVEASLAAVPQFSEAGDSADVRHVHLGRLAAAEARQLAASLLRVAGASVAVGADSIAEEAGGHPLFIDELVQHTVAQGGAALTLPSLDDALWTRISRLGDKAGEIVRVVSLVGGPLRQQTAAEAADLEFGEFSEIVARLRGAKLTRTTGTGMAEDIEPYHGRVRDAVLGHTGGDELRRCHRRLALALEAADGDPEALATHWFGAGDRVRAAQYAEAAAVQAVGALAFERAARLYRQSMQWRPAKGAFGRRMLTRLGDALANAGRGAEAAQVYLDAAEDSSAAAQLELTRMAADQLLRSGHIDAGLDALRRVLAAAGLKLASTEKRALRSVLKGKAMLRMRGLRYKERDATQVSLEELTLIDIFWTVSIGLANVDHISGAEYQGRHLLLALEAGEPSRICRALAVDVQYSAGEGARARKRTRKLIDLASGIAKRIDDDHGKGLVMLAEGISGVLEGRWAWALSACEAAEVILRDHCTNVWWERNSAQLYSHWALIMLGRVAEVAGRIPRRLREAEERGDRYATTNLRTGLPNLALLVAGDAQGARAVVEQAMGEWSRRGFHIQHFYGLLAQVHIDLYLGDGAAAYTRVTEAWPALEKSLLPRVQLVRALAWDLRARTAIAVREPREAEQFAKRMARERTAWIQPLAELAYAGVSAVEGDQARAEKRLRAAVAGFDDCDMALHAAAARRRLGSLVGGDDGAAMIEQGDAWMREEGTADPDRITALFAPV